MFRLIEARGFTGHYTNAFGTLEDMQWARGYMVEKGPRGWGKSGLSRPGTDFAQQAPEQQFRGFKPCLFLAFRAVLCWGLALPA